MSRRRLFALFGSAAAVLGTGLIAYQQGGKRVAIEMSRSLLKKVMVDSKCPGLAVAVSVDGRLIWSEGFGVSDVENGIKFTPSTIAKVASISKPITMALVGKLMESGTLDIDADIRKYVEYWPEKYWNDNKVIITTRQLASHFGGVREYKKIERDKSEGEQEFAYEEYYIMEEYKSVKKSLDIFKDDPLINEPGTKHQYTNHGYTLLSAVLEGATGKKFKLLLEGLFRDLDLQNTSVEDKSKLVYGRSREYVLDGVGDVVNAPFTVSSFKIAGAGLVSNVIDLAHFGNVMLHSRQHSTEPATLSRQAGYLKPETVRLMWTPINNTNISWNPAGLYGLGWQIIPSETGRTYVGHTGGTIGASSALIISFRDNISGDLPLPQGVVVAVIGNVQGVSLGSIAVQIAHNFEQIR